MVFATMSTKGGWFGIALGVVLFLGCGAGQGDSPGKAGRQERQPAGGPAEWLEVKQPNFQLREAPGHEARPLMNLYPGSRARSLGEQSTFTTPIELGGKTYDEPWLLVEMEGGRQGWAYALAFLDTAGAGQELPLPVRLRSLFAPELAEQIGLYREAFGQAATPEMVAQAMAMGSALRDTLVGVLALRAQEEERAGRLFWLRDALPAFVPHLMEDGKTFYLFLDYRPYLSLARASEGRADDAFLELCLMAYPEDSIEYFYPAWAFQASENEAHSLLGRGLHFRFLEKLDELLVSGDLFEGLAGRFREQLVNDIAGTGVTYWESREKATEELDRILEAEFAVLPEKEKKALRERRRQFEDPEKYGIKFNYRSGIYGLE